MKSRDELKPFWHTLRGLHRKLRARLRFYQNLYRFVVNVRWVAKSFTRFTTMSAILWVLARYNVLLKTPFLQIRLRGKRGTLHIRPRSSDAKVVEDVFLKEEYKRVVDSSYKTVIDCGANIGISPFYFLLKCPNAHVIAIEPDDNNFELCVLNLKHFAPRVTCVKGAVWSSRTMLCIIEETTQQGAEWGRRVDQSVNKEVRSIRGYTMNELIKMAENTGVGVQKIGLVKMDIEGAEMEVFGQGTEWLDKVRNIAIELHGKECKEIFFEALSGYMFECSEAWQTTNCRNISVS